MRLAYLRFHLLAAAVVVSGCPYLGGRSIEDLLSIPEDLLIADTEEALLASMSLSDGCSLAGTWRYEDEEDPKYWGYMIIEVVHGRVRGTIKHHEPALIGKTTRSIIFRGSVNSNGRGAIGRTAFHHPPVWIASLQLTPNDGGLNMLVHQPHSGGVGVWTSTFQARKIQSGQCQKSVLYVARIEDWHFHTSSEGWDEALIERNRMRDFCIAAHQGDAAARYTLGNQYKLGLSGTAPDSLRAYLWFSLAGGYGQAVQFKELEASNMTSSEFAEAERVVARWRPSPYECELGENR